MKKDSPSQEKRSFTAGGLDVAIPVEIVCVFTHFVFFTLVYYFVNHAMFVVTSHTAGDKLIYVRQYKTEIGAVILELVVGVCGTSILEVSFTLAVLCLHYAPDVSVRNSNFSSNPPHKKLCFILW